jgi:sulfatase modifying factor 1
MKTRLRDLFIVLALLAGVTQGVAQGARFFRVSGPTMTTILAFQPDGTLVWSNALPGATYTVQTVSSLPGGTNWVDYVQIPATDGVVTNRLVDFNPPPGMALIPAGSFTMGDSLDGESDAFPTSVYVSAFWVDANLVGYGEWQPVYSWATGHGYSFVHAGVAGGANFPVQAVEWFDTVKWCNARSQQEGLTPVYYTDAGLPQVYTSGETNAVYPNWTVNGYRLPTEAEWEKAARGGLGGQRFPWGITISGSQANYYGCTAGCGFGYDLGPNGYNAIGNYPTNPYGTSPVGSFPANGFGLHDMAGNLFEWCWDWYAGTYAGGTDPRGPAGPSSSRVVRGGYWSSGATQARCAYRDGGNPDVASNAFGFRCVRGF